MMLQKTAKNAEKFCCEHCDYSTSRKSQYDRHLATDKHKTVVNLLNLEQNSSKMFKCICGKSYKYDSGYYRHKKVCEMLNAEVEHVEPEEKEKEKDHVLDKDKDKEGQIFIDFNDFLDIMTTKMSERDGEQELGKAFILFS
jgi:hypothetical protein